MWPDLTIYIYRIECTYFTYKHASNNQGLLLFFTKKSFFVDKPFLHGNGTLVGALISRKANVQ